MLFTGVMPAGCEPADCDVDWLNEKLKSKMLLFDAVKIFDIFALLVEPLGRPIGFNFLFFGASSASPSI